MPFLLEEIGIGLTSGSETVALPGSGTSQPGGLECQFVYNGLTMHNRQLIDRYQIVKIDGLDDADVRDSRENNENDHGETPYQSFYGGRTITLEGKIRANNLNKLRDMQQGFRYSFSALEERPLYFLKASSLSYGSENIKIDCRKISKISMTEEQKDDKSFFRDFQVSLRASNPWFESANEHSESVEMGFSDIFDTDSVNDSTKYGYDFGSPVHIVGNALYATASTDTQFYKIQDFNPGASADVVNFSTTATVSGWSIDLISKRVNASVMLYSRLMADGASSYMELHSNINSDVILATTDLGGYAINASTSYFLWSGKYLGDYASFLYRNLDVDNLSFNLGDGIIHKLTGDHKTRFGGDPEVGKALRLKNVPFDMPFTTFASTPSSIDSQVLSVENDGNFVSKPKIRIYGPCGYFKVENRTFVSGESDYRSLLVNHTIGIDDYLEYDTANWTLKDSSGVSQISKLDVGSQEILLSPGSNDLHFLATYMVDGQFRSLHELDAPLMRNHPSLEVNYRNTWI